MLTLKTFATMALAVTSVFGTPLDRRQGGDYHPVTGASGGVQPRIEIRQMEANADLWNLFLTSLERLQKTDQKDPLSWYSIAAIHGSPARGWGGNHGGGDPSHGYCPHSSNMFGTWHRPYLCLLEQQLQRKANEMIDALPAGDAKTHWQGVAGSLRLPYWDWAVQVDGPILPASCSSPQISVKYVDGTTKTIANPLYSYTFHPLNPRDFASPWNRWDHTVRNPRSNTDASSPSNNDAAEGNLQGAQPGCRSQLYTVLSQKQAFNQFSNHGSEKSEYGSLESIHDTIHNVFGTGHMLDLAVSAYDAIFWLHHANIDRVIAMFQALYPDTYVGPFQQSGDTYAYRMGTTLRSSSPLYPFTMDGSGTPYTSDSCRDHNKMGYTYPELTGSTDELKQTINRLYGGSSGGQALKRPEGSEGGDRPSRPDGPPRGGRGGRGGRGSRGILARGVLDNGLDLTTYYAQVEAPWGALDGSYQVRVYLGDITSDPYESQQDPNYCGSLVVMARKGMHVDPNAMVSGTVVLDHKIKLPKALGGLGGGLSLDHIVQQIIKPQIKIRIEKDDQEVPLDRVPGLVVRIVSAKLSEVKSDKEFPVYSLTKHKGITGHHDDEY